MRYLETESRRQAADNCTLAACAPQRRLPDDKSRRAYLLVRCYQISANLTMKPPEPDAALEVSLRPPMFSEFTGQRKVCERLELLVAAAKKRGDVLQHILL